MSEVVLRLIKELPKNQNFQLYVDNWFSTLPLLSELKSMGITSVATFCSNRLGGYPLVSKKDLKKRGRGSFDYWMDYKYRDTFVFKWFDNICVVVESSFLGVECTKTVKRYDLAQTEKFMIDCPDMFS